MRLDSDRFQTTKTPPVAIVNQEFARRLFRSENAVGRYFKNSSGASIQIVGLMADGEHLVLGEDPKAAAFFPISEGCIQTSLVVRTRRDTADMVAAMRKVIRDLDHSVPIQESGTWTSQLALSLFPVQMATVALGPFGTLGLLLSITGTFGLTS